MKKYNLSYLHGVLFLVSAQVMIGINIVFSKYVLLSIPVMFMLAIRFTLATVILLPLHWLTPAKKYSISHHFSKLSRRDWLFICGQGLSAGILFNFLMMLGLHYTDANMAGIITSVLPSIIAVMSWIILRERISSKQMSCILLASAGLVVIAFDKLTGVKTSHSFLGDSIVFLSLLPEAAYYVLCKMHSNSLPVFLVSSFLNGVNAIILLICLLFVPWTGLSINFLDWFILTILGLSSGLFYVFWYFGSKRVDGVMASISTAVMPVATVIIAWIVLGEHLSIWQFAGMGMVILSIAVYAKR
jgi:drug/metabolite transporter (DMT)-like permease